MITATRSALSRRVRALVAALALLAGPAAGSAAAPPAQTACPATSCSAADGPGLGTDPAAQRARRAAARTIVGGLGAWIDLWDWLPGSNGKAAVTPSTIDAVAIAGAQTLYVQTSRPTGAVLESPTLLATLIARARARGMHVVAWYLPTTTDPAVDLAHLRAAATVPGVDAIGIDAESTKVTPVTERNRRLVDLVRRAHQLTTKPVTVIVPSPTALALWAAPTYWPGYPFADLAPYADAYLTMTCWGWHTTQITAVGQITGDVTRLRDFLHHMPIPIHVIGSPTNTADIEAFADVAQTLALAGGSVYDVVTTPRDLWPALRLLRR